MEDTSFSALPDLVDGCVRCTWYQLPHQQMLLYLFSWHAGMLVNSSSRTSKHFNMVRNILISIIIFISTLKIELILWQVDLLRVDLVASWSCESWSGGNWSRENWSRDTESFQIGSFRLSIFITEFSIHWGYEYVTKPTSALQPGWV